MAKPKPQDVPAKKEPRPGQTYNVSFSIYPQTDSQLAYLCSRVAGRQGGNLDRLRSPIIRALIAGEYQREKQRESQEQSPKG
jgi:hypothetical protein